MMENILYSPPAVFLIFLAGFALMLLYFKKFSPKSEGSERALSSYACGESDYENYINPDYMQFFRYAFVFTVMHVLALVITTAPKDATLLPILYVAAGIMALLIIFRK